MMNDNEKIMLLKLNRIPSFIRRDLAVATSLAQCRNALIDAGHPWKTIEGAYIFVHPHQYRQAMAATRVLRPDNIIVSASIEHLVAEVEHWNLGTGLGDYRSCNRQFHADSGAVRRTPDK